MPSVPLMRARPSFSCSTIGSRPAAASASAPPMRVPAASRTSPSPIAASAQCASGARSPEQPRLPYSPITGVMPALSSARTARRRRAARRCVRWRGSTGAAAWCRAPPRARPRPRAGRVAAHERPLQLLAALGRDVGGREGAEARGDAVVRRGVVGELVDEGRGMRRSPRAPRRSARPARRAVRRPRPARW